MKSLLFVLTSTVVSKRRYLKVYLWLHRRFVDNIARVFCVGLWASSLFSFDENAKLFLALFPNSVGHGKQVKALIEKSRSKITNSTRGGIDRTSLQQ